MTRMKKIKNTKKGFSIGEVVISAFIVVVALVAMVNLIANSLKHSMDSRDHIIASQLAQEGVELVRNLRDNNWVEPPPAVHDSFDGNEFRATSASDCRIDKDSNNIKSCAPGANHKKLYYENGFYVHNSAPPAEGTKFQRKIELSYNTGFAATANDLTVTSIVIWGSSFPALADCNASNKCVYTQSVLTRWGE